MRIFIQFIRVLKALRVLSVIFGAITLVLLVQLLYEPSSTIKDNFVAESHGSEQKVSFVDELHSRYFKLLKFYSELPLQRSNRYDGSFRKEYRPLFNYSLWRPRINHTDTHSDRIIEQLVWFMEPEIREKIQRSKPKHILILDHLSKWNISETDNLQCPGGSHNCRLLENQNKQMYDPKKFNGSQIDAVIMTNWKHDFITNLPQSALKISYFLESPYSPSVRTTQNSTASLLASYWRGSDIVAPYAKWVYYNNLITTKPQGINYAEGKTHKVAIFVSNCLSFNDRIAYTQELGKYIQVDIYGHCGPFECPKREQEKCFEKLLKEYKFYLSFENANCKNYITEKFFHNALRHNVLPVVLGGKREDYKAVAPHNSFIHTDSFASPKELAIYLIYLDNTDVMYNEYFQWKGTGEFIDTHFLCRVCAMLNYADMEHNPREEKTAGFPWTFRNKDLCLESHRWSWIRNDVNPKENWDSTIFVNDRLNTKSSVSMSSQKMFPVYKKS